MITPLRLLELAEAANPPDQIDDEELWWREVEFKTPDGWSLWFYYDAESLDYIDRAVSPDGVVVNPWAPEYDDTPMRDAVIWWRGVGGLERLRGEFKCDSKTTV